MAVPYTFGSATSSIPLSQLDSNFATGITLGNTTVYLGNTTTSFGNVTLTNVTISSVAAAITPSQGGTGLVTIPANNVILGNGTSNVTVVAPGTSGNVLTSNGTTWSSSTISAASVSAAGSTTQVQYNNAGAFAGSANLTFNGTTLTAAGLSGPHDGTVGATTPNTGSFTTLAASSTVSGTGFSTYLASPPAIGSTAANTGAFTTLSASSTVTLSGGTANGVTYLNGSKVLTSGSALTFNGSLLQLTDATTSQRSSTTAINGTVLGKYSFSGYDGSSYTEAAKVEAQGQSSWASVSREAGLYFSTLYNSALGVRYQINNDGTSIWSIAGTEGMRLNSTGLGIGTSSPSQKLHVYSSSSPVILLENSGSTTTTSSRIKNTTGTFYRSIDSSSGGSFGNANNAVLWYDAAYPMIFGTNNTKQMTLDASGNLGLGVTPSAWGSGYKTVQVNSVGALFGTSSETLLGSNIYVDSGGNNKYITTSAASMYRQTGSGSHIWYIAGSGTAGNIISFTNAMSIDTSGNLLVGTTSVLGSSRLSIVSNTNSAPVSYFKNDAGTSPAGLQIYYSAVSGGTGGRFLDCSDNAARFFVAGTGVVNSTSTSITAISDRRMKENIRDIDTGLNEILALQPRRFDWKKDKGSGKQNVVGFIAQEVEAILPDLIGEWEEKDDETIYKSLSMGDMIPTLVKAIQEQQAIIESLKARLDAANL